MKAIISIHDATPYFQKEIELFLNQLHDLKVSLLVTPLWYGQHKVTHSFRDMIRDNEKVLHGLTHLGRKDDYKKIELGQKGLTPELKGLTRKETKVKLSEGKKLFEESFGHPPAGFVPPMWRHNMYSLELIREMGFSYAETWLRLINLRSGQSLSGLPMSFDYGRNLLFARLSLWHSQLALSWMPPKFLRFALHPQDIRHGFFSQICDRISQLRDSGYSFYSYEELIS